METSQKTIRFVVGYIMAIFAASTVTMTVIVMMSAGYTLIENKADPSFSVLPNVLIIGILAGTFVIAFFATLPALVLVIALEKSGYTLLSHHIGAGIACAGLAHAIAHIIDAQSFTHPLLIFASCCGGAAGGWAFWKIVKGREGNSAKAL